MFEDYVGDRSMGLCEVVVVVGFTIDMWFAAALDGTDGERRRVSRGKPKPFPGDRKRKKKNAELRRVPLSSAGSSASWGMTLAWRWRRN